MFWKNFILFRDLNLLRALSQDILFPEGKMFLSFLVGPGVLLPTALETLEGHNCCFFDVFIVCIVFGCEIKVHRAKILIVCEILEL